MSTQGEKSCKMFGNCNHDGACDLSCDFYNAKDGSDPEIEELVELEAPDVVLLKSDLDKFTKNMEFVVLKRHLFYMQSISPKKIILKYKKKLRPTDPLADGIYCFKNGEGDPIEYKTAFKMIDTYTLKKKEIEAAKQAAEAINEASKITEEE